MKRVSFIGIGVLVFLVGVIWISSWRRFPTKEEMGEIISLELGEEISIDANQGEIGVFWIRIVGEDGARREYGVEHVKQWTFPWQQYDWNLDGE